MKSRDTRSVTIVKIGGSVLTDKARLKTPRFEAIEAFGRELAEISPALRRRLILVIGGGSFGNAAAHPAFEAFGHPCSAVHECLVEWCKLLEDHWRAANVDCTSFLASSLFRPRQKTLVFCDDPIREALAEGSIPLIFGDLVATPTRTRLVSSDILPVFIGRKFDVDRVVSLTNVEGVWCEGTVLRDLRKSDRHAICSIAAHSDFPDSTGGMRLKVMSMFRLAAMGIEGVICSGYNPTNLRRAVAGEPLPGTVFKPDALGVLAC